jgi:zinc transport system permease protein
MNELYRIMDVILPFEWARHAFMKDALLGVLLVTPAFALLGTMAVNNRMAFFSDAIGHSALTGIAIGVVAGLGSPLWSMVLFSIFLSAVILWVKRAGASSTDTVIGVFSSCAVALGVVLLSRSGGFTKYSAYLIGDLLSIGPGDLLLLAGTLAAVLLVWFLFFNRLLLSGVNPALARSRGVRAGLYDTLFTMLTAVVVTLSIQWVGILIISSLLILPAAAARNIAGNMRRYHLYAVCIALFSGIAGLIISYYWGTATGATIVLVAAGCFAVTFAVKGLVRR